jgi:hypothetical protein
VALAGLLLGACDPIQIEVILSNNVVHVPSPSQQDGGTGADAGVDPLPPSDFGACENGWRSRELAANPMHMAFEFDSAGVGHYAITHNDWRIHVGSTRTGDSLAPAGDLSGGVKALAIDANGRRHLVYYTSSSSSDMYYAQERAGGGWQTTLVTRGGLPTAVKIDSSGFAHVALGLGPHSDYRLGYATNRSGQWEVTNLGVKTRNAGAELAVDAQGRAHLAWHDDSSSGGISYASNVSGAWVVEQVSARGGNEPVIALDPWGFPHVLYSEGATSARHGVKHNGTGSWTFDDVGGSNGIALDLKVDAAGNLHALLDRSQNPKVVYATRSAEGSSWSYKPLITLNGQGGVTYLWENVLGFDAAGKMRVGYWYMISSDTKIDPWNFVRYAEPCP